MALAFLTFVIFEVFIQTQGSHISFNVGYTPLRINEIACTAEKLKSNGGRYTCDYKGQVHCTEGWADDEPEEDANRCALPVCEPKCKPHGLCTSPNFCACEVGWDGAHCEICIPMPGCVHGQCRKETVLMGDTEVEIEVAQTCECEKFPEGHSKSGVHRFEGPKCDRPCCEPQCENDGWCVVPGDTTKSAGAADQGKCACPIGFSHSRSELENSTYTCSECMKAAGCKHGGCAKDENSNEIPGTCTCVEGFTGPLCDQLQCKSTGDIPQVIDCGDHGVCTADILDGGENGCVCEAGWKGEKCDECRPYWECPNQGNTTASDGIACVNPNECWCKEGSNAIKHPQNGRLCNAITINGDVANPNK